MALKVLGQVAPAATTDTDVYTVPAAKATAVSTVSVCNRGTVTATYRIAVRPAGAAISNEHYVAYDTVIAAKSTDTWTIGISLAATDVVTVYASTADLSVSVFGDES